MPLKIKTVFKDKKCLSIFAGTTLISLILFFILTFSFSYSYFIFFNYFLKEAVNYIILTLVIVMSFSIILGLTTSYISYYFRNVLKNKNFRFLSVIVIFYIISYILMLANTSYSLFSYTEMNGFFYTFINFLLLALILPLSSLFIVNISVMIKNIKNNASGIGGLFAGLFSMGCPTCGTLLLSLFGITAGLTIFPLRGIEVKLLSLGLLGFVAYKLNSTTCSSCNIRSVKRTTESGASLISPSFDNVMLITIVLAAGLIFFNQIQILGISSSLNSIGLVSGGGIFTSGRPDLSGVDISEVSSTAVAIATVFPELKNAKNEQDVINIMLPSGTPEYSEALGGITFDDPVNSLNYLARWYYTLKEEIKQNDPQVWQRYLNLAAAPRGISCEFCCGVGPQGITTDGNLRCGCQHNPALQAITLGLMKYTDYSDTEILREVMKWKTIFFPKNMIALGVQVAGQDPSQIKNLPGMVGGC